MDMIYVCKIQLGKTALLRAAENHHTDCVRVLLAAGAEKEFLDEVRYVFFAYCVSLKCMGNFPNCSRASKTLSFILNRFAFCILHLGWGRGHMQPRIVSRTLGTFTLEPNFLLSRSQYTHLRRWACVSCMNLTGLAARVFM